MKKAALHNLGCKVNAYETEAMQRILEQAGYEIVPFSQWADVYVINTCSVTNMADRKSRQMLHRAKKQNPQSIVVAAGCYAQTGREEVKADPAVDIILGNNCKKELVSCIERVLLQRKDEEAQEKWVEEEMVDINEKTQPYEEMYLCRTSEHTRAFLKVQDGCNQFCSYCIIPYARGRVRSRALSNVLSEVKRLSENGYQEIVLTGIHLSSYGTDCGENLLHLIREVHKVDGIERIRLGSLEPKVVTEEFAKALSELPKVCPHFHLSLQSGCDGVLQRMNRKYTTTEYENGCEILRRYFEHPAITTDVIVGFPGETEEEFAETQAFLNRIHFYEMHVFKYSKRKGTRAAVMENQVPEETKTKRSSRLLALDKKMSEEFRRYYVDTVQSVLFEESMELDKKNYAVGYTKEYVRIAVETKQGVDNQILSVRIKEELSDGLYLGEFVNR